MLEAAQLVTDSRECSAVRDLAHCRLLTGGAKKEEREMQKAEKTIVHPFLTQTVLVTRFWP